MDEEVKSSVNAYVVYKDRESVEKVSAYRSCASGRRGLRWFSR